MTIEIHELVIRAEIRQETAPSIKTESMSREEINKWVERITEQVLRELRYRRESSL